MMRRTAVEWRVLRNSAWLLGDKAVRLTLTVVVTAAMARFLGAARFGLFNVAQALVLVFTLVTTLGLESTVVRDIVRHPADRRRILASALLLRVTAATLAMILCPIIILMLRPGDRPALELTTVLALSLLPLSFEIVGYGYQADVNAAPVVLIRNGVFAASAILRIVVIVAGLGMLTLAATFVLENALSAVLLVLRSRRDKLHFALEDVSTAQCRRLLAQSWPLMVSNASIAVYMRIDQLMLGQMRGDRAAGIFSAAVRLTEAWYPVPVSLMASAAPVLTSLYLRSRPEYDRALLRVGRLLTGLSMAVAAFLAIGSPMVIRWVYGSSFSLAAPVLAVHAWSGVFVCLGIVGTNWLMNTENTRFVMYQTLWGALANVALNVILIPRFGPIGAAVATVASYALSALLSNGFASATRPAFRIQLRSMLLFAR
jgi:polysaccharide transporter, PST family